jgi:tRNA pseudouridine55 synthase
VVDLDVVVDCTTGTYIRSLARDLGAVLGVGGHLTRLRRTRVGPFTVDDAVDVYGTDAQISAAFADEIAGRVIPASSAVQLAFPTRTVGAEEVEPLRHGRPIPAAGIAGTYGVLDESGSLVALVSETGSTARSVLGWLTG